MSQETLLGAQISAGNSRAEDSHVIELKNYSSSLIRIDHCV